jgi:epoxide hydrolase
MPATAEEIRPFRIEISDAELEDLRDRLARARWPDELPGFGWTYGVALEFVVEITEDWRTPFDWRKQEAVLNEFRSSRRRSTAPTCTSSMCPRPSRTRCR